MLPAPSASSALTRDWQMSSDWNICVYIINECGPGSSVGIATDYGLDGPGSNPGGGRGFPPAQTGPGAHPASCKMGTGSFPGVNCGRGVLLTTHPLLVPRSWKSRAIPPPTLWATPVLLRDHFTFLPEAVVTVLCTPGDGCGWHLYHELWTCRVINRLLCVGSRWTSIISDARNKKRKI